MICSPPQPPPPPPPDINIYNLESVCTLMQFSQLALFHEIIRRQKFKDCLIWMLSKTNVAGCHLAFIVNILYILNIMLFLFYFSGYLSLWLGDNSDIKIQGKTGTVRPFTQKNMKLSSWRTLRLQTQEKSISKLKTPVWMFKVQMWQDRTLNPIKCLNLSKV